MQPCAVCGSVTINTAGYCAQCGTFRGVPGYQQQPGEQPGYGQQQTSGPPAYGQPGGTPGYPVSGAPGYPQSGHGYPVSGAPGYGAGGAPGYPVSGAPGYPAGGAAGYPASGTPGYPAPGGQGYPVSGAPASYPAGGYPPGGYPPGGVPAAGATPGGYPASPGRPGKGRAMMIPLLALGSTLAVLVVAIVVVLAVRGGGGSDVTADPTNSPITASPSTPAPSPTPSVRSGIDACVVGTWRATSHEEVVTNEQLGKLTFTGGEGAELTLDADGEGETDYGNGTEFESVFQGKPIVLAIRGAVAYSYQTDDGQVTFSDIDSDAETRVYLDGEPTGQWVDFRPAANATSYTCQGNALTQKSLVFTTTYRRLT